jgi:putative flippase GtrA
MERARELNRKYGVFRAAQFGVAGVVGFLALEAVVLVGLYAVYGRPDVSSGAASSPTLITLDVIASVIGVTVGFFVNERTTVRDVAKGEERTKHTLLRLAKFQGVYVVGNAITIGVQLALLAAFGVSPALGNVAGAVVAYPPSYFISMRFVWKTR